MTFDHDEAGEMKYEIDSIDKVDEISDWWFQKITLEMIEKE